MKTKTILSIIALALAGCDVRAPARAGDIIGPKFIESPMGNDYTKAMKIISNDGEWITFEFVDQPGKPMQMRTRYLK